MSRTTRPTRRTDAQLGRTWPEERDAQVEEYDRRESAVLGEAYNSTEAVTFALFTAKDTADNVLIAPRRITSDIAFVCAVDAAAIATDGITLEIRRDAVAPNIGASMTPGASGLSPAQEQVLAQARDIWRRSKVRERLMSWAEMYTRGAIGFRAVRMESGRAAILAYDPRHYTTEMDRYGLEVESTSIHMRYYDSVVVDPRTHASPASAQHTYGVLMTADEITTYVDGERVEEESGPNKLGAVPFVTAEWSAGRSGMPGWAGGAIEESMASVDSLYTQGLAIGGRHANPWLVLRGMRAAGDEKMGEMGRILEMMEGGDAHWLETSMSGARFLVELATQVRTAAQQTVPEFLFIDAGANSSGTALSYRAGAFVAKITPKRERFYRALALVTSYAVAIEMGSSWGETMDILEVQGGSALPGDVSAILDNVHDMLDRSTITLPDAVRTLQENGLLRDDVPPDEYADLLRLQRQEDAAPALERLRALAGSVPDAPEALEDDALDETTPLPDEPVAS